MFRKMLSAALTAVMVLICCTAPMSAREIPRDELEKLKEELMKEIDDYGSYDWYDMFFDVDEEAAYDSGYAEEAGAYMAEEAAPGEAPGEAYGGEYKSGAFEPMPEWNTEEYNYLSAYNFTKVSTDPLSTFAADVDTGSFCNLRRMLKEGYLADEIPGGAVRTEELLNYFDYKVDEANISDGKFSVQYETADCPWNPESKLLLMTVQANQAETENTSNNFTFLLDTSGSMDSGMKIALAKCSIKLLCYTLDPEDRVSIVTYSGDSYTALDSCPGDDYDTICETLDSIYPYGGTNGSGGINQAYRIAEKNYDPSGNNRVFILSDGDMNLGITSQSGLVELIREKKESGIFLSVLGFGSGNYSDANMEQIADAGNGNYFYIDCLDEAERVLIEKQKETTVTVAKDVKFQAEFNPAEVSEYRLLGYENRDVADDDFKNDAVDGGEVGAGQQVTVMYELKMAAGSSDSAEETALKYQENRDLSEAASSGELLTLSVNYKEPDSDASVTEEFAVKATSGEPSGDMNLAVSLAELSMILRGDANLGTSSLEEVRDYAVKAMKGSGDIYRAGYAVMCELLA